MFDVNAGKRRPSIPRYVSMRPFRPLAFLALTALAAAPALLLSIRPSVAASMPPSPAPSASPSAQAATIVNSGSTNFPGYRIALEPSGVAYVTNTRDDAHTVQRVDPKLAERFFAAIAAVGPMSGISVMHCMKSASFGSTTTVTMNGATSPDISCGGDAKVAELAAAADSVAHAVHAGRITTRRLLEGNVTPAPAGTATP